MNKKIIVLTLTALYAIGSTTSAYATKSIQPENSKNIEQNVKVKNRYEVIGITNVKEFEKSFNIIKSLVQNNEISKVANYVSYPLNVNKKDKKIKIKSKENFIKSYNTIITEDVKKALLNQDVTKTFVNYQGVMVGDGEVWFTHIKNKAMIYAINIFEINEKHGVKDR
ncbi:hypothetical protein G9F71_004390 [Clostridium sp. FP2]|uniref:hypothetical protein n=1 Tax=Clostridium sp. FP2 TaxID=2724481 RepID=UPI0013E8F954|nr:hypothetical protein [Clostridium sp. FP2]MBZ9622098.1 hypothetical protein [Clostridium sp. FP2]